MKTVTTSIRMRPQLRKRLEQYAQSVRRGKTWIIEDALETYLNEKTGNSLIEEARRQSILASSNSWDESEGWETSADTEGWV